MISLRSSPWKAGHVTNPWHDEFDHGHVHYYGDHKPTTVGLPGATAGNRALIEAWALHAATDRRGRLLAPPLLIYRSVTIRRDNRSLVKGHVEFCGAAIIERLEHVVQRDPETGRSFPNLVLDLAVVDLAGTGDTLAMRWIDDRRDPQLDAEQAVRHAGLDPRKDPCRAGSPDGCRRPRWRRRRHHIPTPRRDSARMIRPVLRQPLDLRRYAPLPHGIVLAEALTIAGRNCRQRRNRRSFNRPQRRRNLTSTLRMRGTRR